MIYRNELQLVNQENGRQIDIYLYVETNISMLRKKWMQTTLNTCSLDNCQ